MNKLVALFAMIAGVAMVTNVEAARKPRAKKAAAVTEKVEEVAEKAKDAVEDAVEATAETAGETAGRAEAAAATGKIKGMAKVAKEKVTAQANKTVAWVRAHPKTAATIGVTGAVATGLSIDLAVRGKNSVLGKLYNRVFKKESRYSQLEALLQQKQAQAAA